MNPCNFKILLVDDEPDILEFLGYNLRQHGFTVFTANGGGEAIEIAKQETPHLIILDVMMPGMDGMECCRILRKTPALKNTLVTFLTARNEDYSQIAGFDSGADDYITKPIKPRVFISRITALLRRVMPDDRKKILQVNDILIDTEKYIVTRKGAHYSLPKKEFELLAYLASKPGKVFKREEILENVWGNDVVVGDRTIDVHVRKLREKFGEECIKTVKGIGYKFEC